MITEAVCDGCCPAHAKPRGGYRTRKEKCGEPGCDNPARLWCKEGGPDICYDCYDKFWRQGIGILVMDTNPACDVCGGDFTHTHATIR